MKHARFYPHLVEESFSRLLSARRFGCEGWEGIFWGRAMRTLVQLQHDLVEVCLTINTKKKRLNLASTAWENYRENSLGTKDVMRTLSGLSNIFVESGPCCKKNAINTWYWFRQGYCRARSTPEMGWAGGGLGTRGIAFGCEGGGPQMLRTSQHAGR